LPGNPLLGKRKGQRAVETLFVWYRILRFQVISYRIDKPKHKVQERIQFAISLKYYYLFKLMLLYYTGKMLKDEWS
jgi:hypothetical protein